MNQPLVSVFLECAPAAAGGPQLEAALGEALARGRARWPGLAVPAASFVRHLAERVPAGVPAAEAVGQLLAEDLYLCCACLCGVAGAAAAFDEQLLLVPAYVGHMDPSPAFADEVRQVLRERLLTAAPGGRARLFDYTGRGALQRWLRVAALRTGLTLLRQRGRQQHRDEAFGAQVLAEEQVLTPELRHLKQRYAESFAACVREAIAGLQSEQRALLRLYWVGGQSSEKIGAIYRVNRSTVVRWLAAAREAVLVDTQRRLCARVGVRPEEFRSLARDLHSQLDLSLATLLRETEG